MVGLSDRIFQLRKEAGLTQTELGEKFGLVKSAISHYERGQSIPSDRIKKEMCRFFGVSMDYLLGLSDDRNAGTSLATPEVLRLLVKLADSKASAREIMETLPELTDDQLSRVAGYIQALRNSDKN